MHKTLKCYINLPRLPDAANSEMQVSSLAFYVVVPLLDTWALFTPSIFPRLFCFSFLNYFQHSLHNLRLPISGS